MNKLGRYTLALVLAAAGTTIATAPASAAGCQVTVTYNTSEISVKESTTGCSGSSRAVLYYFLTPQGPTMYSTRGSWVTNGTTSTARTSPSRYFAGSAVEWA